MLSAMDVVSTEPKGQQTRKYLLSRPQQKSSVTEGTRRRVVQVERQDTASLLRLVSVYACLIRVTLLKTMVMCTMTLLHWGVKNQAA